MVKKAIKKYKDRIIIGIDSIGGKVAIGGWKETTSIRTQILAKKVEEIGAKEIIFTSIKRDGTLKGPDMRGIKNFAKKIKIPIFVSGGISSIDDVKKIVELEKEGIIRGMVIGKALYTDRIKLKEAIEVAEK